MATPPLPPGYVLDATDDSVPPLPQGYTLDQASPSSKPALPNDYLTKTEDFIHGLGAGVVKNIPFVGNYLGRNYSQAGVVNPAIEHAGETTGRGYEQALEMTATGGPLRAGAEALATKLPYLGRLAAPLLRVGAEGVNAALSAGIHGQPVGSSAALGLGGALVGEAVPLAAPPLKRLAAAQYGKFLGPTKQATKTMAGDVVPELLERRVVATSGQALENRAVREAGAVGTEISQAAARVPASVQPQAQPILDSLERYKQGFYANGVAINDAAVRNVEALKTTIEDLATQPGAPLSYQSLNKARQILDTSVARSGGYVGKTLAEGSAIDAQREAANAMRAELARQSPDIAKLNAEYHFWRQVGDVMSATNARRVGQVGGLMRIGEGLVGAGGVAGAVLSGKPLESVLGAGGAIALAEAVRSPLWRTASAVTKNALANALASGNGREVAVLAGRFMVGRQPRIPEPGGLR